ncbi:MAG: hypothetical protein IT374_20660 [Polyangiaceae bacterium]|nr:hypothetical protein [Polyangiaceae bacterium]
MCRRVECDRCHKPTFAGCGRHVEEVLRDVPPAERCRCREDAQPASPEVRPARSFWDWFR